MQISYWQSRWQNNQIGFHNPEINTYLAEYFNLTLPDNAKNVLVPLCGKTKDMLWLQSKGLRVIGIEAIPLACEAFFEENRLSFERKKRYGFEIYLNESIEIWCGDFFRFPESIMKTCNYVYDRACIVALPIELRNRYVKKLAAVESGTSLLMHTFTYDQEKMSGPPFSVPDSEIQLKFGAEWDIKTLFDDAVLPKYEKYKTRGLDQLSEAVYHLVKK